MQNNSSIYVGRVSHTRYKPVRHGFSYRLFMMYLDLDELPGIFKGRWFWSDRRPALARYRREDHMGDPRVDLKKSVQELIQERTGERFDGPIRLLTHLRYFGFCFNPVSFYYCFAPDGQTLRYIVAEVNNTPWGEQHCYVVPAPKDASRTTGVQVSRIQKAMHVSPYMPMDMHYDWRLSCPGETLDIHMKNIRQEERVFSATLRLKKRVMSRRNLALTLALFPMMTLKVVSAIYFEALRLWIKRVPIHDHPADSKTKLSVN